MRITVTRNGDWFEAKLEGGPYGSHQLTLGPKDRARLLAHATGYGEQCGLTVLASRRIAATAWALRHGFWHYYG